MITEQLNEQTIMEWITFVNSTEDFSYTTFYDQHNNLRRLQAFANNELLYENQYDGKGYESVDTVYLGRTNNPNIRLVNKRYAT